MCPYIITRQVPPPQRAVHQEPSYPHSGDNIPRRMTGVTLHRHVRCVKSSHTGHPTTGLYLQTHTLAAGIGARAKRSSTSIVTGGAVSIRGDLLTSC